MNDVFQEVYAHLVEDEGWDLEDAEEERDEYQFFLQEQLKQTLLKQ